MDRFKIPEMQIRLILHQMTTNPITRNMNFSRQIISAAIVLITAVCSAPQAFAQKTTLERVHENTRETPYPQAWHRPYINPVPLLVPKTMKTSENMQFQLSMDKDFKDKTTITSEPEPRCMFNAHRILEKGTWYWRVRPVDKDGKAGEWSQVYDFSITGDEPEFVTPSFEEFFRNMPKGYPRIYCFIDEELKAASDTVAKHAEYKELISRANLGMKSTLETSSEPYKNVKQMALLGMHLYTAYRATGDSQYAEKLLAFTRSLLPGGPDQSMMKADDFYAGDFMYLMLHAYDACHDMLTPEERDRIHELVMTNARFHHYSHTLSHEETHIFDNHFWQRGFREMLQIGLVFGDTDPVAKEMLEYCYELWTARAPASGFNRDGEWQNGTGYFTANVTTLWYVPSLFSYMTGTDFLQHPWYRNAGKSLLYNWPVGTMSAGFGDQNEHWTEPDRQRAAFADFIARELDDPYAAWYASHLNRAVRGDFSMRLYRMARGHVAYPNVKPLPEGATKAVWFHDIGQLAAHSALQNTSRNLFLSFRSSPFGSGSHTLADQNSFNLHFRGVPVYRSTGYYLNFSDAHNIMSYRHTRAHNTILVDGIGQPFTTRAYGKITRMLNGDHISYALGDASNAYCGVSEYPMWEKNFERAGITQTPENGFGETPLTKYRRHIFLLHPDIVLIYDDLEASKPVRWDWLLHSPVSFRIDDKNHILTTRYSEKEFTSYAQLFSNRPCTISQTDEFRVPPDLNKAKPDQRDKYVNQWHLTAAFEPCATNRILTIIKIMPDGTEETFNIRRDGNKFIYGRWVIRAELDPSKPASLNIVNTRYNAVFDYSEGETVEIDGKSYERKEKGSSVLYDLIDGEWIIHEMSDYEPQITGKNQ